MGWRLPAHARREAHSPSPDITLLASAGVFREYARFA
jgi:hypothetical protein